MSGTGQRELWCESCGAKRTVKKGTKGRNAIVGGLLLGCVGVLTGGVGVAAMGTAYGIGGGVLGSGVGSLLGAATGTSEDRKCQVCGQELVEKPPFADLGRT